MTVNFTCNEDRSNCSFPAVSCTKEEVTLDMPCNTGVGSGDSIALHYFPLLGLFSQSENRFLKKFGLCLIFKTLNLVKTISTASVLTLSTHIITVMA